MAAYDHPTIDRKWQQYWEREHTFATPTDRTRPKYYVLDMFPYPSGDGLHVGHPRGYTATDVIARAKRMMGFNVLRVMGWDSFGLPAERRAEHDGIHPSVITARNIAIFKSQLEKLGLSYDWARQLATSDPRYYKWTQWIFELLFERGLAYRAEVPVNFCPALGTVLANEEVHDGKYIETGDPVEKRLMTQWVLRITAYADRLVEELDGLDWPAHRQDAARLDRQVDRRQRDVHRRRHRRGDLRVHDASGHAVRRHVRRAGAGASARRAHHHISAACRGHRVLRRCRHAERARAHRGSGRRAQDGRRDRRVCDQSRQRRAHSDLGRRLRARELRHRRRVRVPRPRRA